MGRGGARQGAGRPRKQADGDAHRPEVEAAPERNNFTQEQLKRLRLSPHVVSVTAKTVSFTLAFKELFWSRYCAGISPDVIFRDEGINPADLGETRIWGLVSTLRKLREKGLPFQEGRNPSFTPTSNPNTPKPKLDVPRAPRPPKMPRSPIGGYSEAEVRKLFHTVAYMSQQLEFIKKIILTGTEARSS